MVIHLVITGVIGSGKTTLASFAEKLYSLKGWNVLNLDYDVLTHQTLEDVLDIKTPEQRHRLAKTVFNNQSKLDDLENKLHPLVYKSAKFQVDQFLSGVSNKKSLIIHQIPLYKKSAQLYKEAFNKHPDIIFTRYANKDQLVSRLKNRGMSEEDIKQRLSKFKV